MPPSEKINQQMICQCLINHHSDNRFLALNSEDGWVLPQVELPDQWIAKIQYLIDHPEEQERMGHNSRKLAEEKFSMEEFKKIIHDEIFELIGKYKEKVTS